MPGRSRNSRGLFPVAIAGAFFALGWVALSIAFGSGSAHASETPPPPSLLGTVTSSVENVVQSTAPVAASAPAEQPAIIAPIVEAVTPVVQTVTQTASSAVAEVAATTDAVAPALTPVVAPVSAVLQQVPTTLNTVTSALPGVATSVDSTVGAVTGSTLGAVTGTVQDATGILPDLVGSAIDVIGSATGTVPRNPVAVMPVPATPPPLVVGGSAPPAGAIPAFSPASATALFDTALDAAVPAPAAVPSPRGSRAPGNSPAGWPGSVALTVPGTGSVVNGGSGDAPVLGALSSTSAADGLLAVRSGSVGDDRLPVSPVADHDSSPD